MSETSEKSVLRSLFAFLDAAAILIPSPGKQLVKHVPVEIPCEMYDAAVAEVVKLRLNTLPGKSTGLPPFAVPDVACAFPEDGPGQFQIRRCPDGTFASEYAARIRRGREYGKDGAEIPPPAGHPLAPAGAAAVGDAG